MTPMRFADTIEEQKRYGEFIANGQVWEMPFFDRRIVVMGAEPPGYYGKYEDAPIWMLLSTPYGSTDGGTAMMACCEKDGKWLYTQRELEEKLIGWKLIADVGVCTEEMEHARGKCFVPPEGRVVENLDD